MEIILFVDKIKIPFSKYAIQRDEKRYLTGLFTLIMELFKSPKTTIQTCYQFFVNWFQLKYICKDGSCDLFYHCRANYKSKNKKAAEALSHFRENVMKIIYKYKNKRIFTKNI